ncbi:hypothetical protein ACOME3_009604 [Neoechinorhynchus agilis]
MNRLFLPFTRNRKNNSNDPRDLDRKISQLRRLLNEIQGVQSLTDDGDSARIILLNKSAPLMEYVFSRLPADKWESIFSGIDEFTRCLCNTFTHEVNKLMAAFHSGRESVIEDFFGPENGCGAKLLSVLRLLCCKGPTKLLDICGICSLSCSLSRLIQAYSCYKTDDLPANVDAFRDVFLKLLSRKACVEQLVLSGDLKYIFWVARMWPEQRDTAQWFHEVSSEAMIVIAKCALTSIVIDYLRSKGCIKHFVSTMDTTCDILTKRPLISRFGEDDLTLAFEAHVIHLSKSMVRFVCESCEYTSLILDDFKVYAGYTALTKFILRFDSDDLNERHRNLLKTATNLVLDLSKFNYDSNQSSSYNIPSYTQDIESDLSEKLQNQAVIATVPDWKTSIYDQIKSEKEIIKNPDAIHILGELLTKAKTKTLHDCLLSATEKLIEDNVKNYFAMQSVSLLSGIIERLPQTPNSISQRLFSLILKITQKLKIFPLSEIQAVKKLLTFHTFQTNSLENNCFEFLKQIASQNSKTICGKTLLLKFGIIDIFTEDYLHPFVDLMKKISVAKCEPISLRNISKIFDPPSPKRTLSRLCRSHANLTEAAQTLSPQSIKRTISVIDVLRVCLDGNVVSCSRFRELSGIRLLEYLIPSKAVLRRNALYLMETIFRTSIEEDDMAQLLANLSNLSDLAVRMSILETLEHLMASSAQCRSLFRKVGGFIFIMSTLLSMDDILIPRNIISINLDAFFGVIKTIFSVMKIIFTNDPINNQCFEEEVGSSAFCDAILRLGFFDCDKHKRQTLDRMILRHLKNEAESENNHLREIERMFNHFFEGTSISITNPDKNQTGILASTLVFVLMTDLTFGSLFQNLVISRTCFASCLSFLKSMSKLDGCTPSSDQCLHCLNYLKSKVLFGVESEQLDRPEEYVTILFDLFQSEICDEFHPWSDMVHTMVVRLSRICIKDTDIRRFLRFGIDDDFNECLLRYQMSEMASSVYHVGVKARIMSAITADDKHISCIPFIRLRDCEWTSNECYPICGNRNPASKYSYILIPNICPAVISTNEWRTPPVGHLTIAGPELSFTVRPQTERSFPPQSGFTFSTWFTLTPNKTQGVINLLTIACRTVNDRLGELPVYKVFLNLSKATLTVSTYYLQKALDLSTLETSQANFHLLDWFKRIISGDWINFTLTFSRALFSSSGVQLYINAQSIGSKKLHYVSASSILSAPANNLNPHEASPRPIVYAIIGNARFGIRSSESEYQLQQLNAIMIMRQGSVCLLEECVAVNTVKMLYHIGPNCDGIFSILKNNFSVSEDKLSFYIQPGNATRQLSLKKIISQEPIVGQVLNHRGCAEENDLEVDLVHNLALKLPGAPRTIGALLFKPPLTDCRFQKPNPVELIKPNNLRLFLERISNGTTLILAMTELSLSTGESDSILHMLTTISNLINSSPTLFSQMVQNNGYGVLRYLLRRKRRTVNSLVVRILFCIISQNSSIDFSDAKTWDRGVIIQDAFEQLICDVGVWKVASCAVQTQIMDFIRIVSNEDGIAKLIDQCKFVKRLQIEIASSIDHDLFLVQEKCRLMIALCSTSDHVLTTFCQFTLWAIERQPQVAKSVIEAIMEDCTFRNNGDPVIAKIIRLLGPCFITALIRPHVNYGIVMACLKMINSCCTISELLCAFRSIQRPPNVYSRLLFESSNQMPADDRMFFFERLSHKLSFHARDSDCHSPIISEIFDIMKCQSGHSFSATNKRNVVIEKEFRFEVRNSLNNPDKVTVPEFIGVLVEFAQSIMYNASGNSADAAVAIVLLNDLNVLIYDEHFLYTSDTLHHSRTVTFVLRSLVKFLEAIYSFMNDGHICKELFDVTRKTLMKLIRDVLIQCLYTDKQCAKSNKKRSEANNSNRSPLIILDCMIQDMSSKSIELEVTSELLLSILTNYSHYLREFSETSVSVTMRNIFQKNQKPLTFQRTTTHMETTVAIVELLMNRVCANQYTCDLKCLIKLIGRLIIEFGGSADSPYDDLNVISLRMLKQFNRLVLYSMSLPAVTIAERISTIDKIHELTNFRHIIHSTLNSDPQFWSCLFYCMCKCTSWTSPENSNKVKLYTDANEVQGLVDLAINRMWSDMVQQHKAEIVYETLGVLESENQTNVLDSLTDFQSAKRLLAAKAEQAWMVYSQSNIRMINDECKKWTINISRPEEPEIFTEEEAVQLVVVSYENEMERIRDDESIELKYFCNLWNRNKKEFYRQRGLLGSNSSSILERWKLDPTEGFARMRRRLMQNSDFYSLYMAHDVSGQFKEFFKIERGPRSKHVDRLAHVLCGARLSEVKNITIMPAQCSGNTSRNLDAFNMDDNEDVTNSVSILSESLSSRHKHGDAMEDDSEDEERKSTSLDVLSINYTVMAKHQADDSLIQIDDANLSVDQSIRKLIGRNEQIREYCRCARITPVDAIEGVLLFGQYSYYFVDEYTVLRNNEIVRISQLSEDQQSRLVFVLPRLVTSSKSSENPKEKSLCEKFDYAEIREVFKRRYLLQRNAIEIFSSGGQTVLLAFLKSQRNRMYRRFLSLAGDLSANRNQESIFGQRSAATELEQGTFLTSLLGERSVTQKWERGEISNFEYLMFLNTIAGRSYNDLMQYPVFPWILADYDSPRLNLRNCETFRDLSKPMGAQSAERFAKFKERFDDWNNYDTHGIQTPYHYNTHYSSAMIVSTYLIRLEPFSQVVVNLQGGLFDLPDRTFHSIKESWLSASRNNMSDVKELIPEFFYLTEFLLNTNEFDFGQKQCGDLVDNVILPTWAKGDVFEFIRLHRAALESDYVSAHLNEWIDLIFGFRQRGRSAVEVGNVFHPLFYEGTVDFETIDDPTTKEATIGFINNFGQVPKQIFRKPHVQKKLSRRLLDSIADDNTVTYLRNQDLFFKAIHKLKVTVVRDFKPIGVPCGKIVSFHNNSRVIAFPQKRTSLAVTNSSSSTSRRYIDWDYDDGGIRIGLIESDKTIFTSEKSLVPSGISCLCTIPNYVIIGGGDSIVYVFKLSSEYRFDLLAKLTGHHMVGKVTSLDVCDHHRIIVSGSSDSIAIIWDINKFSFVRQLVHSEDGGQSVTLNAVRINRQTADIVSCTDYELFVWTVNGYLLAKIDIRRSDLARMFKLSNLDVTTIYDWDSDNVIVCGTTDGLVMLWRLKFVQAKDEIEYSSSSGQKFHDYFDCDDDNNDGDFIFITRDDLQQASSHVNQNQVNRQGNAHHHFHRLWRGRFDEEVNRLSIDLSTEYGSDKPLKAGCKWKRSLVLAAKFNLNQSFCDKGSSITAVHIPRHHRFFYVGTESGRIYQFGL